MSNCNRCGKYLPSFFDSICQECESIESERNEDREREEERQERAASDRYELIEQLVKTRTKSTEDLAIATVFLANNINNPGDYICPYCKFKTLKEEASCCPRCHKNIESKYWNSVDTPRRLAEAARKAEVDRKASNQMSAKRNVIIGSNCNVDYEEWQKNQRERISANTSGESANASKKSWFARLFLG